MQQEHRIATDRTVCISMIGWVIAVVALASGAPQALAGADHQIHDLGAFALESGKTLPDAKLAYVTHGTLNADKNNVVLLPSAYAGNHHGYDYLIGPGKALDPARYFIVVTNMFGNGLSTSPSNTPAPFDGPNFPSVSTRDNVNAAHRLLTEKLGVKRLKAVIGFSMGAQQAFQWAVSHPSLMDAIVPYCGTAKEYPHGIARLAGFKSAVMADAAFDGGRYAAPPLKGLKAGGRHWAAWGTSQEWYRRELFKQFGHKDLEDHLENFWEAFFSSQDANNLIAQADTWQQNNVGNTEGYNGDHEKALRSIKARVLYMPCQTDLYFPPEYARYEAGFIGRVKLVPIPSVWGHLAGLGVNGPDNDFINKAIADFLK
ncbi:MAG: alpha/beta fold hydrolase [Burkholderiales bacterium]|nr:alpha/beta fold hydrolase [Burkholderiales bacterium]